MFRLVVCLSLLACPAPLLRADEKSELQDLIKQLKQPKEVKVRVKLMERIAAMGPDAKEASQALIETIIERTPAIRQAAIEALEKVNLPLHKPVVALLVDNQKQFEALAELVGLEEEAKPALPLLLAMYKAELAGGGSRLRTSGMASFGTRLLQAMAKLAPEDKSVLQVVLDTITVKGAPSKPGTATPVPPREERLSAIELCLELEKLDAKLLTKALMTATADPLCKLAAIETLGELGPRAKEAIPTLKKLKLDSDEKVRDAAAAALERVEK